MCLFLFSGESWVGLSVHRGREQEVSSQLTPTTEKDLQGLGILTLQKGEDTSKVSSRFVLTIIVMILESFVVAIGPVEIVSEVLPAESSFFTMPFVQAGHGGWR